MQLAERWFIKENPEMADLCRKQTPVYNQALWYIRQEYFNNDDAGCGFLSYYDLNDKAMLKWKPEYRDAIPGCASNTIQRACDAWKGYWRSLKTYSQNPSGYTGKPKMPGYVMRGGKSPVYITYSDFSIKNHHVCFPKASGIKRVYTKQPDQKVRDSKGKVKQVRIIPSKNDGYWVEIVYNIDAVQADVDSSKKMAIDLGLNRIATITDNQGNKPIAFSGGPVKSINHYYNKKLALLKSEQSRTTPRIAELQRKREAGLSDDEWREWKSLASQTKAMKKLTEKRNNKVNAFFHRLSRKIVDTAIERKEGIIVIGHNPGQKQEINLGKRNNQNFVQLPIFKLVGQIKYKAEMVGIKIVESTEEYTSKASFLDGDAIPDRAKVKRKSNGKSDVHFSGKRGTRALYTSANGTLIHADVNGSYNILRKAFPDAILTAEGIQGERLHPEIRNIKVS